ncbi:NAD(P)H-quinone oxidoreductase [Bradymonadaceae bacterium TMQ3]|uniref:NAD(P)H-quinone oxidoreductase n=2 Tax=Lujinxingia sediminis TaxID=2480984 RepID=A0ABY0CYN5_9DELT|nr:NAD(P)H-quinone oxidoreductase [Bradymonadaceae bacterium TMQ3]RVU49001.1 NAD(P)H-quinone oxidoreductase [Lujinxingia sediminis]TXC78294.1 NAD(P)H-quinone oxidoreductase [Bradymonadales bacterium TMQ1]
MNAIAVDTASDTPRLFWTDHPRPKPASGEVLIKVHATAVNRADLLQARGRYPVPAGASTIMGLEAAGEVVELGEGVEGINLGDRVCALLTGGGYAEYVASPASLLLPLPDALSMEDAAALPEVFYTAFLNLYIEGQLEAGERALIHAAGSGVGTAALQLCRLTGNPVLGTASASKLESILELGAERAIDRHTEDFAEAIREWTDGEGVDVILDPVGATYLDANLKSLTTGGRLIIIGLLSGASAELSLGRLLMKRLQIKGSVLRSRTLAEKEAITVAFKARVWPHVVSGALRPIIETVLPIDRADDAHRLLASNQTTGKIVLRVRP